MANVDTQRPALEHVSPQHSEGFWLSKQVFQERSVFYLEEGGERAQVYFSGISHGDGIYAKKNNVPIAGFVGQKTDKDSRMLTGVPILCGVLLRPASYNGGVEVVLLKFKEFWYADKEEEPEPVLELVFEATDKRTAYTPL
jgi:hypothetical protein|tara:strand:- start:469 stop:891 length:423 start_codon:yes stop_codon:yes gene_type:complete